MMTTRIAVTNLIASIATGVSKLMTRGGASDGSSPRAEEAALLAFDESARSNADCKTCMPTSPEYLIRLY